jgi:hypothetical protein
MVSDKESKTKAVEMPKEIKDFKLSCKGIQQKNNQENLNYNIYSDVLHNNLQHKVINKGFRILSSHQMSNELVLGDYENNNNDEVNKDRSIYKYEIYKTGLSNKYTKRLVLGDGVSTVPLNI